MKASELIPLIQEEAIRQKVDPAHAIALFMAENSGPGGFNPNKEIDPRTTSNMGAVGVMQVRPATLQGLINTGYVPPNTTLQTLQGQITAGVAAVKEAASYGDGSLRETAIRYNAGMGAWKTYKTTGALPDETSGYLAKIGGFGMNVQGASKPVSNPFTFVSSAEDSLGRLTALMTGAGTARQDAMASLGRATEAGKKANTAEAAATSGAVQAKTNMAIADEANLARLVDVFQLRSTDQNSRLSKANAQYSQAAAVDDALTPEVTKSLSINPLEDPIGFITARLSLMQSLPTLNAARSARERSLGEIGKLQALASNQAQLERVGKTDQLAALAKADGEAAYAAASAKNARMDQEFEGAKLNDLLAGIRMEEDLFGRKIQVAQISVQTAQLRGVEEARAEEKEGINLINTGLNMFGLPSRSKTGLKALSKETQDELARMGAAQGATSAGKYLRMALDLNAIPTMQQTAGLRSQGEFLGTLYNAATQAAEKPTVDAAVAKMPREARIEFEADKLMKAWNDERVSGRYDTMTEGNPFRMNAGIFMQAPGNADNPITKYLADVRRTTPTAPIDEKLLLNYATEQVKAGGDTKAISENLAEFMRAGQLHQFKSLGLPHFGASLRDPKLGTPSYPVTGARMANRFVGTTEKAVQMLSPTEIENYLFRVTLSQRVDPLVGPSFFRQ